MKDVGIQSRGSLRLFVAGIEEWAFSVERDSGIVCSGNRRMALFAPRRESRG